MKTGEVSWDKGPWKEFGLDSFGNGELLRGLKHGHAMLSSELQKDYSGYQVENELDGRKR